MPRLEIEAGSQRERDEPEKDLAVFQLATEAVCSACGKDLGKGNLLRVAQEKPLCLDCAGFGRLVVLPRGDTALTRRARKHSTVSAVILKFARARKRYERQGTLVEPEALARAEEECRADAARREAARGKAAARREVEDARYLEEFTEQMRRRYPACPTAEAAAVARHACEKYSGRVGRSAGAKLFDPGMIDLAVRAYVRHEHTDYDARMDLGGGRSDARAEVSAAIEAILRKWRQGGTSDASHPGS